MRQFEVLDERTDREVVWLDKDKMFAIKAISFVPNLLLKLFRFFFQSIHYRTVRSVIRKLLLISKQHKFYFFWCALFGYL
jgi:hypothetical protein